MNALVTDLQPDSQVLASMNAIESQRRMRMAAQEKAEADKILIVKAAEAESEAKYLSGKGVARQRKAIVDGLKESVVEFNDGVAGTSPADVMKLMMVTQYLGELSRPRLLSAISCAQLVFDSCTPCSLRRYAQGSWNDI